VELSHRPQRPAKQPKKSEPVPVNPSWETVFRAAMQPMSRE
jgi:nucleoid DNA-binding protein